MFNIFHGWRRKLGLGFLALDCLLAMCWLRSRGAIDVIMYPLSDHFLFAASSVDEAIACKFGFEDDELEFFWGSDDRTHWNDRAMEDPDLRHREPILPGEGDCPNWYWRSYGISIGESPHRYFPDIRHTFVIVPYWLIVLPLTLLSARLLLSSAPPGRNTLER